MSACAVASFLLAAGPAPVPFRACCSAALITAEVPEIQCTASDGVTKAEPVIAGLAGPLSADVPIGAPDTAAAGSAPIAEAGGSDLVAAVPGRADDGFGWLSS